MTKDRSGTRTAPAAAGVLLVAAAGWVTGCGGGGGGSEPAAAPPGTTSVSAPGTTPAATTPPPSRTATAAPPPSRTRTAAAAPHTDTSGCYDGSCRITVTKPVTIRVDAHRFGFGSFRVTRIAASGVTVVADTGGTHLESGVSPGGTAGLNELRVHVLSATDGSAELQLTR